MQNSVVIISIENPKAESVGHSLAYLPDRGMLLFERMKLFLWLVVVLSSRCRLATVDMIGGSTIIDSAFGVRYCWCECSKQTSCVFLFLQSRPVKLRRFGRKKVGLMEDCGADSAERPHVVMHLH